jgi:hypothetical protein
MQSQMPECRDDMHIHVLLVAGVSSRTQSWLASAFDPCSGNCFTVCLAGGASGFEQLTWVCAPRSSHPPSPPCVVIWRRWLRRKIAQAIVRCDLEHSSAGRRIAAGRLRLRGEDGVDEDIGTVVHERETDH